jgi:hypothetical protein
MESNISNKEELNLHIEQADKDFNLLYSRINKLRSQYENNMNLKKNELNTYSSNNTINSTNNSKKN